MNWFIKGLLTTELVCLLASHGLAQQVRDFTLDDHLVYAVPVSAAGVTTVSFPSPIAALDGALITMDGKTPGLFQVAHTKGTAYFSARALARGAATNLNVRWNNRTYVFALRESAEPCYSLILRSPAEKNRAWLRPLSPNRLLGLLDKAKAFALLQQVQPEAVQSVEYRDGRAKPLVSDCGDYEIHCLEAFRFPEQDTLIFSLQVINKGTKVIEHVPEKLKVRAGDQVFTPALADLPALVSSHGTASGYIVVTGTSAGTRNDLSLKNDFTFVLSRRDPGVEAAAKGFEQIQQGGGFSK